MSPGDGGAVQQRHAGLGRVGHVFPKLAEMQSLASSTPWSVPVAKTVGEARESHLWDSHQQAPERKRTERLSFKRFDSLCFIDP
jgi:hypothetical protein